MVRTLEDWKDAYYEQQALHTEATGILSAQVRDRDAKIAELSTALSEGSRPPLFSHDMATGETKIVECSRCAARVSALERARRCIELLLAHKPVRDVTETLAEIDVAMEAARYFTALAVQREYAGALAEKLRYMTKLADEAYSYLDADMDMKCLKLLMAMSGRGKGYRADVDEVFAVLADKRPQLIPSPPSLMESTLQSQGDRATVAAAGVAGSNPPVGTTSECHPARQAPEWNPLGGFVPIPGWTLVPNKPDLNMTQAALVASREHGPFERTLERPLPLGFELSAAEVVYEAMLAAAPEFGIESPAVGRSD